MLQIEIKARELKNGNRSLYLVYYDGELNFRKKETLNLYLIPDNAPKAKAINNHTLNLAQEIRSERLLNPPTFVKTKQSELEERSESITWLEWCDEFIEYSKSCGNCKKMIDHKNVVKKRIKRYLTNHKQTGILLKDVTSKDIAGLFDYMKNKYRNKGQIKENDGKLADYTLLLFQETVNAIFNKAVRENLIKFNPMTGLLKTEKFHAPDKHREALTVDELKRFLSVETSTPKEEVVQRAFGFACMTGLRLGDMQHLRWCDIKEVNGTRIVSIVQRKTKRPVSVPLNETALSLLPPQPNENSEERIFPLAKKPDFVAMYVRRIKNKAGIDKDITFHCSRHTAATLAITAGAELFTVSKILGHGSLESTQVYAKVDLKSKIEAVNLTDGVFD
jgi:integrase